MYGSRFGLEVRKDILGEPVYHVDKCIDIGNSLLKDASLLTSDYPMLVSWTYMLSRPPRSDGCKEIYCSIFRPPLARRIRCIDLERVAVEPKAPGADCCSCAHL